MNKLAIILFSSSASTVSAGLRGQPSIENRRSAGRSLQTKVDGECTVENFAANVGGQAALASLLKVTNDVNIIQAELGTKCARALQTSV